MDTETVAAGIVTADQNRTLGPFILGLAIDALFFGAIINQSLWWVSKRKRDWTHIRWIMYLTLAMTVATTGYTWAWSFDLFVENYGTYLQFVSYRWSAWYAMLDVLIIVPLKFIFLERAYRISGKNKPIAMIILLALIATSVAGIGFTITLVQTPDLAYPSKLTKGFIYLCPAACVISDLLITSTITYYLLTAKTGWLHTDSLITKIIILTVEAQVPGCLMTLVYLVHDTAPSAAFLRPLLIMTYGKPYMIGTLAVLNSRHTGADGSVRVFDSRELNNSWPSASNSILVHTETQTKSETEPA